MSEVNITVHPFRMGTDKEAALKPLEEAAEVFGAYQRLEPFTEVPSLCPSYNLGRLWPKNKEVKQRRLADEIADCIQACVNLAGRYDIDLADAMERCEERNRARGRCE
jgi:NTP pyrophosphatase (non-canonical NTP hydrolase)